MVKKKKDAPRELQTLSAREAVDRLLAAYGGREHLHLVALWENWAMVMGDELAALAFPLGHKDDTLVIGAEDTMAMQEVSLLSPEILERVNAFMNSLFFRRVRVQLMQGQRSLAEPRPRRSSGPPAPEAPPRPARLGGLVGKLPPGSAAARCYEAYLAMFQS